MRLLWDGPMGRYMARNMADRNAETEAEAVEALAPEPAHTVLVIGFGPGVGLQLLAPRARRVIGVDPSAVMTRAASKRAPGAELHRTTADRIPLGDATVDGVLAVNSFHLWKPFEPSVAEVARVLKPGARLVTFTHDWAIKLQRRTDADEWIGRATEVLERHGLVDARTWRARAEAGRSIALVARRAPS